MALIKPPIQPAIQPAIQPSAALTGNLLARKGFARPAMRSPLQQDMHADFDDLGWNDMGDDALPSPAVATEAPIDAMVRLIRIPPGSRRPRGTALVEGRRAAFTLRLDAGRHGALRLACGLTNQSAQNLLTDALDRLLTEMPKVATLSTDPEDAAPLFRETEA